jgi:hypothetical protein
MSNQDWTHRGARALVVLHKRELHAFMQTWRAADATNLELPTTQDPSYASLTALLCHVLGAARGYLLWACETLELAAPDLKPAPDVASVASEADEYLATLLAAWDEPLRHSTERTMDHASAAASWGPVYCVDAMLEHAVMHPARHRFQLEELLAAEANA